MPCVGYSPQQGPFPILNVQNISNKHDRISEASHLANISYN
jgi:hypothetical protein